MNCTKTLYFSALAALVSAPAIAAPDYLPQVYGRADVSLQADEQAGADPVWELSSNASRFGVHNSHALNDSLSVLYRLELEVELTERRRSTDRGFMRQRNSYVGVQGSYGTVFVGVHDTPFKKSEGKIDLFGNYYLGDIKSLLAGQTRVSDAISYVSPRFGDLQAWLMILPGEGKDAETGTADSAQGEGLADAVSASLTYKTKPLWLALAADKDVDGQDRVRISAQFSTAAVKLGAILQRTANSEGESNTGLGYSLSAQLNLNDRNALKGQFTSTEDRSAEQLPGATMTSLGWDHKLGKNTRFTVYLTDIAGDLPADDRTVFGTGLRHDFGNKK